MPTGVALRDAREQLLAAAERILRRGAPGALTSRAVTDEAGVAKGVLHRHFADFDAFLAEVVLQRVGRLDGVERRLVAAAGSASVVGNLAGALAEVIDPVALGMVGLVTSRDALRARLRRTTPAGIPLLAEIGALLGRYLAAERDLGRIVAGADVDALAFTLVGAAHLLFAGDPAGSPAPDAVAEVVACVIVGAEPGSA